MYNDKDLFRRCAPPSPKGKARAALREVYLPARYGEKPASREDVRRAREALERLRRR